MEMKKKHLSLDKFNIFSTHFSNVFLVKLLLVASLICAADSSTQFLKANSTIVYEIDELALNEDLSSLYETGSSTNLSSRIAMNTGSGSKVLSYMFVSFIYIPIIICTIVGNTLVVLAVVIVRKLHTQDNANNFLIVSLALSDFLVGVMVMPFHVYVELSSENK